MQTNSNDLRTKRTHKAIRTALETLILTKNYRDITIKELSELAGINRKTFYLHYKCLDDLFEELEDEIVEEFTAIRTADHAENYEEGTRNFFRILFRQPDLHKRLICSEDYFPVFRGVQQKLIRMYRLDWFDAGFPTEYQSLLVTYFCTSIELYRQWIADGERISADAFTDFSVGLLCGNISERLNMLG
ncbi:MAG: TetR/AcrR family transcriptional regulator [Anaerofustis sp.]